jgi:superfamily I DNA/RNA helicase
MDLRAVLAELTSHGFSLDEVIRFQRALEGGLLARLRQTAPPTDRTPPMTSLALAPANSPPVNAPSGPPSPPVPASANTASDPSQAASSRPFIPSVYQQAIFDFIEHGDGDLVVNAYAGSGKTTTLVEAAKLLTRLHHSQRAVFFAFNRSIVGELEPRLAGTGMQARTIHSMGFGCLFKRLGKMQDVDRHQRKYHRLCRQVFYDYVHGLNAQDARRALDGLEDVVNFCRLTLTDPADATAMERMIEHFAIELDPSLEAEILRLVPNVLAEGQRLAEHEKAIDYTDMVFLPHMWNLQPPQYDVVFVDEAQDLNAAQLALVLKSRAPGGRIIFVGDLRQAIMGFAGADAYSFQTIQRKTNATVLPLSICYRCPTSHLELAQAIVPEIEAAPNAAEGIVGDIKEQELLHALRPGDLVICRLTAPVVSLCLRLIQHKRAARVKGRDIEKHLTDFVYTVSGIEGFLYARFGAHLSDYETRTVEKMAQRDGSEGQIESFHDRVAAVRLCYESFSASSVEQLCEQIASLFRDQTQAVELSTVHRAKGLEYPRVFILRPEKLPLRWANQREWEGEQERNLKYVALTRAKEALYFVETEERVS